MEVRGRRRRGRPKTRWKDCIAADMREKGLNTNMTGNRGGWRRLIKNSSPRMKHVNNAAEEKGRT